MCAMQSTMSGCFLSFSSPSNCVVTYGAWRLPPSLHQYYIIISFQCVCLGPLRYCRENSAIIMGQQQGDHEKQRNKSKYKREKENGRQ